MIRALLLAGIIIFWTGCGASASLSASGCLDVSIEKTPTGIVLEASAELCAKGEAGGFEIPACIGWQW